MSTLGVKWGAVFGLIAVILGAFGAHGLKDVLQPEQLRSFETGVRYQLFHAVVLLFLYTLPFRQGAPVKLMTYLIVIGVFLFSGSIYLLAARELTGIDIRSFGWITPIGGALLIAFWTVLAWHFMVSKS